MKWVLGLMLAAAVTAAQAAEVRFAPADSLVLNTANSRGYYDLVLHAAVVATGPGETAEVRSMRIDLMSGGEVKLTREVSAAELVADTGGLASAGMPVMVAAQLLQPDGLDGLLGRPTAFADSVHMQPSTALVLSRRYFATDFQPDSLRITVHLADIAGRLSTVESVIAVRPYTAPIAYRAPLTGTWLQQAVPTLQSHHRLNPSTEFAVDYFRVNDQGGLYAADSLQVESAYGYGAEVLAVADGVVVSVIDDEVQDRAAMLRRPDETPQQAGARIGPYVQARMARDFRRAAGGNLVVIRHEANGTVEYSSYGHLKTGSASVRPGDQVRQGQVIGQVGDTGDSPAVHLHFQINAGPDPFTSKSLPVRFANARSAGGNTELGRFVVID